MRYWSIGVMLAISGCASNASQVSSRPSQSLEISSVGIDPKTIEPRTVAFIRYSLSHPANVSVDLVDEDGYVVRRLHGGQQSAGKQSVAWDGLNGLGHPAAAGVYRYVIIAEAADERAVHDPSAQTGGEELTPSEFSYDKSSGKVRWAMPRAGRVRIRAGVQGFPHLRTLVDWQPMDAGPKEIAWDGRDADGLVQLSGHPQLQLKLNAYALADNTVIVRGTAPAPDRVGEPTYATERYPSAGEVRPYLHARHERDACREARLSVEFPASTRTDNDGRVILSGEVPVRIRIADEDARRVTNSRFEMMMYEDLTVLFEEEDATNPFTFVWNTSKLPPGRHLLTVNLLTYDDHYGVATVPVVVEAAS